MTSSSAPETATATSARAGWSLLRTSVFRRRSILFKALASATVWSTFKISVPLLVAAGIDHGIVKQSLRVTVIFAAIIAVVGTLQGLFAGVRRTFAMRLGYQVETDLRERLFGHLQRLHFGFHDQAQTGQLMSRSASDLQQVSDVLFNVPITIASVLMGVGVTIILALTQPLLALLAMWPLLTLSYVMRRFSVKIHPAALDLQNELGELASVAEEAVSGVRTIKGFGAESVTARQMSNRAEAVLNKALVTIRLRSTFAATINLLPTLGLASVLFYGGRLVIEHRLQLGSLVAATIYVQMLVAPLTNVGFTTAMLQRAVAACERVDQVLSLSPVIVDPPHPLELPTSGASIHFSNVDFAYPGPGSNVADSASVRVLRGFELEVQSGESIALVGATGSGKSTVAKLLPRFYDVTGGAVTIAGIDVRRLRLGDLRRAVGLVFEDTFLLSDSIGANIAFAEPDASAERVRRAARQAGIADFIESLAQGYDTELGERGLSLSGGQRQRISIARALLRDPRVLILDDATSAVDPEKEREIAAALSDVMKGRTTVLIAHRIGTIILADRVAFIADGRVAAVGTHEELIASSPEYRRVLATEIEDAP